MPPRRKPTIWTKITKRQILGVYRPPRTVPPPTDKKADEPKGVDGEQEQLRP